MHKPHLRYKDQTPQERTWTIHFISIEKVVKATVLVALGFKLLSLFDQDVHGWAVDFASRHGIDLANRYVEGLLGRLTGVGNTQIVQFSIVAFVYAAILYVEGIGLWLQKRWAEWLTAIATGLFIPIEIYEFYERATWVRAGLIVLNCFVVWYLVTRLQDEKQVGTTEALPRA